MNIDLSALTKDFVETVAFDQYLDLSTISMQGGICPLSNSVHVHGHIKRAGGMFLLHTNVSCDLCVNCDRCGVEVQQQLQFWFEENLAQSGKDFNEDADVIYFDGNSVDVLEIIVSNISLNLPTKFLCKEDCKGLCSKCGCDFNFSSCGCKNDDIDPRLMKFKDFLK